MPALKFKVMPRGARKNQALSVGQRAVDKLLREVIQENEAKKQRRLESRRTAIQAVLTTLSVKGKLTQTKIADLAGVKQSAISRYMHGRATPTPRILDRFIRLAQKRNLPLPELNGWREL